jgi:hypothetical protein
VSRIEVNGKRSLRRSKPSTMKGSSVPGRGGGGGGREEDDDDGK